jgi:hypothetical protein
MHLDITIQWCKIKKNWTMGQLEVTEAYTFKYSKLCIWFVVIVFNATLNNISAISWRPVLVVEEAGVPGENHRPWANNW